MIGEFEYLIVAAAARLGDEAYGASIREEITSATGRSCSLGALYTTVDRLQAKGLVQTWMGESTPQRGGRAKRMIKVTAKGATAAKEFYEAVSRVSAGLSWSTKGVGGNNL